MIGYYFLAIFFSAIGFAFSNGIVFALSFLGAAYLPCVAIAGAKWGILMGDSQQKIIVPIIGFVLLALAYWLSTNINIHLLGFTLSGFGLAIISGLIGLVGVPTSWGGSSSPKTK